MTCNKTLQGKFVSSNYTPSLLVVVSVVLMVATYWLPPAVPLELPAVGIFSLNGLLARVVSMIMCGAVAFILSQQTFFERRIRWVGALFMWMVAVSTFANSDAMVALLLLLFMLSFAVLLLCQHVANVVPQLYTAFAVLGSSSLLEPQILLFVPLYVVFIFCANIFSLKGLLASLLGLLTPFWLLFGLVYVFPSLAVLSEPFMMGIEVSKQVRMLEFNPVHILLLSFVLAVLVPATAMFFGSASPAKPLLRRRLLFVIIAEYYILLLFCFVCGGSALLYMCLLPGLTVLLSYMLSTKATKVMNVYFILVNIFMVAVVTHSLWLKH